MCQFRTGVIISSSKYFIRDIGVEKNWNCTWLYLEFVFYFSENLDALVIFAFKKQKGAQNV